jgi:hypothetical protein
MSWFQIMETDKEDIKEASKKYWEKKRKKMVEEIENGTKM